MHLLFTAIKIHSHRGKAKLFFDGRRLFSDDFCLSLDVLSLSLNVYRPLDDKQDSYI